MATEDAGTVADGRRSDGLAGRGLLPAPVADQGHTTRELVHDQFEKQARLRPHAFAVGGGGKAWSYAELDARARLLARLFVERGAGPDRVVAVCLPRGPRLVAVLLGVLRGGAASLPLDRDLPAQRMAALLRDAEVRLAVTDHDHGEQLSQASSEVLDLDAI